jgi:protein TonB
MNDLAAPSPFGRFVRGVIVAVGAIGLALACFLVLPLLQALSAAPLADLMLTNVDVAALPPPPPPELEPEKPEPEPEEQPPPALADEAPPLDLAMLELALNPGAGGMDGAGDFALRIAATAAAAGGGDDLFSLADLDQKPRVLFQQQPQLTAALRKKTPATVLVVFTVDAAGRVEDPVVQSASDPAFEAPTLAAIRQWKFEPGRRGGQPVRFRMRQPFNFQ